MLANALLALLAGIRRSHRTGEEELIALPTPRRVP